MSVTLPAVDSLSEAWVHALDVVHRSGGKAVHLGMTISTPALELPGVRKVLDEFLARSWKADINAQSISTVSETIFPLDLYRFTSFSYSPDLASAELAQLDGAADRLYSAYLSMLPTLTSVQVNNRGTYFSRMITWPGNEPGGPNQLDLRIQALRNRRRVGTFTNNLQDLDLSADSLLDPELSGLQLTKADESRIFSFPCLVHISLTLFRGRLNMLAVYRHSYLVTKSYGNMLGLSYLQHFIAQQSGFEIGELAIQATFADDQATSFNKSNISDLLMAAKGTGELS